MIRVFKKESQIRSFEVVGEKVFTTIELNGYHVTNPTLEQFKSIGWEEYVIPTPEPYVPTLEELVENKIRERYSINQEFEVQRKRNSEPDEFQTYYNYVEECIAWAKEQDYKGKEEKEV